MLRLFSRSFPTGLCQFARGISNRREWVPYSYSLCPSLGTVEAQNSTVTSGKWLIYLRCHKELAPGPQTHDRWMGTLGQGQSHLLDALREVPILQPTNDVSLTGNLTSETLDWASDLVDLGKADNTFESDTDDHERFPN